MEPQIIELTNGLRIVYCYQKASKISHCGFVVNVGSRDEKNDVSGIAHLLEHMLFKGTVKRKAFQVLNRLDRVGGEVNAFTTKEKLAVHSSFLSKYAQRAIELLCDQIFYSNFPDNEFQREKTVILDEILASQDYYEELILDDFEENLFKNSSLANSILGTSDSVNKITKAKLIEFYNEHFSLSNMVFAYSGNLSATKIVAYLEKYTLGLPNGKFNKRNADRMDNTFQIRMLKNTTQAYCTMGINSLDLYHPKRLDLLFLNSILGGDSLTSKLNMNIREKFGFVYSIDSSFSPYFDNGVFAISFATDPSKLEIIQQKVIKEIVALKDKELSKGVFHSYKTQFKNKILMAEENKPSLIMAFANSLIDFNRIDTLKEIFDRVEKVQAPEIKELANSCFDLDKISSISYIPEDYV